MVNFIICDDDHKTVSKVCDIIDAYMMKNKIEYKKHNFYDYDGKFMKVMNSTLPSKIYILDIETPSKSGIDVARMIRKKDIHSVIIFLTGHEELFRTTVNHDLLFLAYINKFDNLEQRLEKVLDKSLKVLEQRNILRISEKGIVYTIDFNDILYITRDSIDRKSIIVTTYGEIRTRQSLNQLLSDLNDNFIKTHRACIVNLKRVTCLNKSKKYIQFDDGSVTDLISSKYKLEKV